MNLFQRELASCSLAELLGLVMCSRLDFAARLRLDYDGLRLISPILPSYGTGRDGCEMRSAASRVTSALVVRSAVLAEMLAAF